MESVKPVESVAYGMVSLSDTLRRQFGITLYLYYFDEAHRLSPHVYVRYEEETARLSIPDGEVLDGTLPTRPLRKVRAWIELHDDELMQRWERAVQGKPVSKID